MEIKWKSAISLMPDGNLVATESGVLLNLRHFSLVAASRMPKKIPITLGMAACLMYDELYDKVRLDLSQDEKIEKQYETDLCAWISSLGFHIEINEADFECLYSEMAH